MKDNIAMSAPTATIFPRQGKVITDYFDSLPVNGRQKKVIFLLSICFFFDYLDINNFGVLTPILIKSWNFTLTQIGWINSIFYAGMFVGGLTGGYLSNIIGRKKGILASLAFFSFASILNGTANGFEFFLVARLFTGIGTSCMIVITDLYLIEMLPSKSRGKWQALVFGSGILAIPVLSVLNKLILPLGPESWRYIYFLGGTGFLALILGIFWLKESPRWLVAKGRLKEAEQIVEDISGFPADLQAHTQLQGAKVTAREVLKELLQPRHRLKTIVLITLVCIHFPAGSLLRWAPALFISKGFTLEDSATLSIFMSVGLVLGSLLASQISDLWGRKWPIVFTTGAAVIIAAVYGHLESRTTIYAVTLLIFLLIQANFPISNTYLAELYPTRIRSMAVGVMYSTGRIFSSLIQLIVAPVSKSGGTSGVFMLMAVLLAIPCIVVAIWGERTSGKSLEELE